METKEQLQKKVSIAEEYSGIGNGQTIMTRSGVDIDPFNSDGVVFNIEDIAHALSNICRFGGHSISFYSVAQHSYRCSLLVSDEYALQALMHDATEAFITDVPTPIKRRLFAESNRGQNDIETLNEKEDRLMENIFKQYNIPFPLNKEVKKADSTMLNVEAYELIGDTLLGDP